ncbi:MAG: glycosyl hydrolase [Actinomycetota bacterium]|nr:glycosyl hydrolase [Actinomycetota bacterium]
MTEQARSSLAGRARHSLRRWWHNAVLPNGTWVAAGLTVCAVLASTQPGHDPVAPTPPSDPIAQRRVPLELGVTVFSLSRDWENHDVLLQRAAETGSRWLRVEVAWCSLEEAGSGQVSQAYQARLDATADSAKRLNLRLLVQLGCAPAWAGGSERDSYPSDPDQFERVARYLAQRYRGRVAGWEVWNEPDCIGGCSNGPPDEFVALLAAGYRGLKAGDPDTTVVSGGISGNDVEWLRRMYGAGAHGWFDALAVHSYQDPATAAPDAAPGGAYRLRSLPLVRQLMINGGDGDKPIWLTEFGWTTARTGQRPGVDPDTQARFLQQAIEQIDADYPYVSHAFWYCLRDRDDSTPYENNFGLLHVRGSPKPAFAALQKANAER